MPAKIDMAKFAKFCKDNGFIFQSSEIYGGFNGFWDYGPLGVELKNNVKQAWWIDMVRNLPPGPDGQEIRMVGLDSTIIMNPKIWVASGHVAGFSDPMVDCKTCQGRFRADHVPQLQCPRKPSKAPGKHDECQLSEPRAFNLMFQTQVGAVVDSSSTAYLRPETAQGIFANYRNVLDSTRLKLPFGIAQVGKAFRNEVTPRNYTFRSREFEQMEIEFFCHPDESMKWYEFWRDLRKKWYSTLGILSANLIPREQGKEELAHYSIGTTDIEYLFPFSDEPQELEGVAHRGAFDLSAHAKMSGRDLRYFDEEGWNALLTEKLAPFKDDKPKREEEKKKLEQAEKPRFSFIPHVIEPSAGADRFTLAVLCEAYHEDKVPDKDGKLEERIVMRLHPRLAPIKAAIFPLVNKDGMPEKAMALYRELKPLMNVFFDDKGAVGRRYRRQDEIGTPFCVTIDGETMSGDVVTIRDRDAIGADGKPQQRKVKIGDVKAEILKAITPS